jgi:hypothetical protein
MNRKTRSMTGAGICAALMLLGGAGTAFAGEVAGPPVGGGGTGGATGIFGHAASECAFSGLNAFHDGKPLPEPVPGKGPSNPTVQSYGMGVRAGYKGMEWWPSPGFACNPSSNAHGG